jgi:Mn-dependent DtxR family transcriptional regulator
LTDEVGESPQLEKRFTKLQGQYLAFIAAYAKLNRRPPAEADFQRFFEVTPPSVHNMIVTLDRLGLIKRTPGRPRSIELLVPASEIPALD